MASVAICPHCYLQLVVPEGVARDEHVECPTCAKEFELGQAVLRAIPQVVRRKVDVAPVAVAEEIEAAEGDAVVEVESAAESEVVESEELEVAALPTNDHEINLLVEAAAKSGADEEAQLVEQVKARIERELADGNLKPGMSASIPLESPDLEVGDDVAEVVESSKEDFASWFRDTKADVEMTSDEADELQLGDSVAEAAEDTPSELSLDLSASADMTPLSDEPAESSLISEVVVAAEELEASGDLELEEAASILDQLPSIADADDDAEIVAEDVGTEEVDEEIGIEEVVDRVDAPEAPPELKEPRFSRPSAVTLADLLPPRDVPEAAPGPSFELPNVPLTPTFPANNGATMEFDSLSSLSPAAETEFELDDVNLDGVNFEVNEFESGNSDDADVAAENEADELAGEEFEVEEPVAVTADADEPVFREPVEAATPAAPFVLPGVPRPRKKRSVVRLLAGTVLGGAFGTAAALFILLWLLGRDGDFLNVAQYLPEAVLPASLKSPSTPQVALAPPVTLPEAEPAEESSENKQASYVQETPATESSATESSATEPAATEPSTSETTEQPLSDDRYATEPSLLDEPSADPIADEPNASTASAPLPLPIQGPTITIDQLATALEAAKQAKAGLMDGDLSDAAVRRIKGMSYAKLGDLANAVTFVDAPSASVESEQAIAGADSLFGEILGDRRIRGEVARIAQVWMNSPHRGHGGIFVAGSLGGGQSAGDIYEYQLTTTGGSPLVTPDKKPVTVLMREPLDPLMAGSAEVGVVGTIVDRPSTSVAGYTGSAERAIWVTRAIPLE